MVGENGKVMVHVQRDMEKLHLVVMNHEHIAGGSSVYEVINQYKALKSDDEDSTDPPPSLNLLGMSTGNLRKLAVLLVFSLSLTLILTYFSSPLCFVWIVGWLR